MAISKRKRFDVFKRDGFKCQYCGRTAPDVVLHVDHIHPKSKGGKDGIINLVTSCADCNLGKSDKTLDDQSALAKERRQLEELQERREQIEMMLAWKRGLLQLDRDTAQDAANYFGELFGCTIKPSGLETLRKIIHQFGLPGTLDAINIASDQYADAEKAFAKISGIAFIRKKAASDPQYETVCRIKGKLRWRKFYVNEQEAERLIRAVLNTGRFEQDCLSEFTSRAKNWTDWRLGMEKAIADFSTGVVSNA